MLWQQSGVVEVPVGSQTFAVHGFMVWCALAYSLANVLQSCGQTVGFAARQQARINDRALMREGRAAVAEARKRAGELGYTGFSNFFDLKLKLIDRLLMQLSAH